MSTNTTSHITFAKPSMTLSVLTLAMLQVSMSHAQDNPSGTQQIAIDRNQIAHVVVSASQQNDPTAPLAASGSLSATSLDLAKTKSSDSASILTALTGVNVQSAGGISALPVVQGLADNRLRVLVNGVDSIASCPNHMNSPLSYVAPTTIKKAKVYTGVTPVSVAANSIGATIVVDTTQPKFAKASATKTASSHNTDMQNTVKQTATVNSTAPTPTAVPPVQTHTAMMDAPLVESALIDNSQSSAAKTFDVYGTTLETSGEIGGFYRSNGDQRGANVSVTTATPALSINYQASYAKANDYQAGGEFKNYVETGNVGQSLGKDVVASTAFESKNQSLDLAYLTGNHLWQLGYQWQHVPNELYPNQRMDMLDNRLDRYNLRYSGDLSFGTLEAQAYHETVDHYMDFGADKRYWYGKSSMIDSKNFIGVPCSPAISPTCASGMPMYTNSTTTGINLKATHALNDQTNLSGAVEYQSYQLDDWWPASGGGMYPNTFQNINNGKRKRSSVYGEWAQTISPTWDSLVGVRYEQVKTQVDPVHGYNNNKAPTAMPVMGSGMMDMMNQNRDASAFNQANLSKTDHNWHASFINRWQLSDTGNIELGLSHQMRTPSLYERYTWSTAGMMAGMNNTVGDGNGYFGDPNLKPEAANKIAVTLDWRAQNNDWHVKLTPYYSQINDYIDAVQWNPATNQPKAVNDTGKYSVMRYTNQDARIYGVDASADIKLAENQIGTFGMTAAINYTHGKNTDTDSPLYNIMPFNGKIALTHAYQGWRNQIEVVGVTAKDKVSMPRNEIKTAGYGLLNLSTGYDWRNLSVTVGIDNALDKQYALPLGGAYMGQGRTMSMNSELGNGISNWGTPVFGAGRTYFTSLNYKF